MASRNTLCATQHFLTRSFYGSKRQKDAERRDSKAIHRFTFGDWDTYDVVSTSDFMLKGPAKSLNMPGTHEKSPCDPGHGANWSVCR